MEYSIVANPLRTTDAAVDAQPPRWGPLGFSPAILLAAAVQGAPISALLAMLVAVIVATKLHTTRVVPSAPGRIIAPPQSSHNPRIVFNPHRFVAGLALLLGACTPGDSPAKETRAVNRRRLHPLLHRLSPPQRLGWTALCWQRPRSFRDCAPCWWRDMAPFRQNGDSEGPAWIRPPTSNPSRRA